MHRPLQLQHCCGIRYSNLASHARMFAEGDQTLSLAPTAYGNVYIEAHLDSCARLSDLEAANRDESIIPV